MLKIGLTGNIGSGKSTVSRIFEILGVHVYHADEEAKKILDKAEVALKIKSLFGQEVLNERGKVDRKKLADIVFSDAEKISELNKIIHPATISDFEKWMKNKTGPYVMMESAILFETGYFKLFDKLICVSSPESLMISRVVKRDHLEKADVLKRLQNQMKEKDKIKKADFVICNDDKKLVIPQVLEIHEGLGG